MLSRCSNKNRWNYKFYGAKGITVCDRWKEKNTGFLNFLADMGDRPEKHQLDRIDVLGGYCKENCRWVNKYIQMGNTTTNNEVPGVGWHSQRKKWRARIKINGREKSLGLYKSFNEAVLARQNAFNSLCIK